MMFKLITYDPEPSVIGVDNGISQIEFEEAHLNKHTNFKEIKRMTPAYHVDDFIKTQHDINYSKIQPLRGKLYNNAKITDFMVFSPYFYGCKYVISQKVVDCFNSVGVKDYEYQLIKVEIEEVDQSFYLLLIPWIPTKQIVFSKSLLYPEEDVMSEEKHYFQINSYGEYEELLETSLFNRWRKICIDYSNKTNHLINIQASVDLFFSDILIERLKKAEVTNLRIANRQIELDFSETESG